MGLILSVDVGTTNIKAGIVDKKGRVLNFTRKEIGIERLEEKSAEHNPQKLFIQFIEVCRQVSRNFKKDISLFIVSSYQFGLILLDKDFSPLTGLITLLDTRAQETTENFKEKFNSLSVYTQTGCPPLFQYPLSKIYYFKKKKPKLYRKAAYFLSSKDYLIFRLTGRLITEPSIASATQMFNIRTLSWDKEILDKIEIKKEQLPEVVEGNRELLSLKKEIREKIGLSSSCKLLPGLYDGGAMVLGMGGLKEKMGISNIGTSGMLRVVSSKPTLDKSSLMRFQTYYLLNGLYLVGGAINNAALPLQWLNENLFNLEYDEIVSYSKKSSIGAGNLFFLPYLTGERNPKIGNFASGVLFGLRDYHTKFDLVRSLLEGVGFSLCLIKEAIEENSIRIREIRMGGRGSHLKEWVKIFSDILDLPIVTTKSEDASLIGNGILGFSFLKEYSSISEGAENMVKEEEKIRPEIRRSKKYSNLYRFYKNLYYGLENLFIEHASL